MVAVVEVVAVVMVGVGVAVVAGEGGYDFLIAVVQYSTSSAQII